MYGCAEHLNVILFYNLGHYILAGILTDYSSSDQAYFNNYPYQEYSNYTYNIPQNSAVASGRKRRVFTTDNPMSKYNMTGVTLLSRL